MTKIQLSEDEKRHIRLYLKDLKASGYKWPGTFTYDSVYIPKKIFAALLTIAYSAIRIKPEPPVEVYALEITTRVKYETKGRKIHIVEKAPVRPDGLKKYLSRLYRTKEDTLLNRFKKLDDACVRHLTAGGITYYKYDQTTFPIVKSENTVDIHSHLGVILSPPGFHDLVRGVIFSMQGVLCVDYAGFAKFVLGQKIEPEDSMELTYKQANIKKKDLFISPKKMHEFAKEYAGTITDHLKEYAETRCSPILIWETNKFGDMLFYNNYEID